MHAPSRIISNSIALAAFSVAIVAGLAAGNPADTILVRAIGAMLCCQVVGWLVGLAGEHVVREHVSVHQANNPLPEVGQGRGFGEIDHSSTGVPQAGG